MIAVGAAIGHKAASGLMRRWSSRALVTTVALTTAAALVLIVVLPSMWTLTLGLVVASRLGAVWLVSAMLVDGLRRLATPTMP